MVLFFSSLKIQFLQVSVPFYLVVNWYYQIAVAIVSFLAIFFEDHFGKLLFRFADEIHFFTWIHDSLCEQDFRCTDLHLQSSKI